MNNTKEMIPEEVEAELKFAMEHHMNIDKHNMILLNRFEVETIAKKLGVKAKLEATFVDNKWAYYVLSFGNFATYFGVTLVDRGENYTYDPAEEDIEESL